MIYDGNPPKWLLATVLATAGLLICLCTGWVAGWL